MGIISRIRGINIAYNKNVGYANDRTIDEFIVRKTRELHEYEMELLQFINTGKTGGILGSVRKQSRIVGELQRALRVKIGRLQAKNRAQINVIENKLKIVKNQKNAMKKELNKKITSLKKDEKHQVPYLQKLYHEKVVEFDARKRSFEDLLKIAHGNRKYFREIGVIRMRALGRVIEKA